MLAVFAFVLFASLLEGSRSKNRPSANPFNIARSADRALEILSYLALSTLFFKPFSFFFLCGLRGFLLSFIFRPLPFLFDPPPFARAFLSPQVLVNRPKGLAHTKRSV